MPVLPKPKISTEIVKTELKAPTTKSRVFTERARKRAKISPLEKFTRDKLGSVFEKINPKKRATQKSGPERVKNLFGDPLEKAGEFEFQEQRIQQRKPRLDKMVFDIDEAIKFSSVRERQERIERNIPEGRFDVYTLSRKKESIKRLNALKKDITKVRDEGLSEKGFFESFGEGVGSTRRSFQNLTKLTSDTSVLNNAVAKFEKGEPLSPEETEIFIKSQFDDLTKIERQSFKAQLGVGLEKSAEFSAEYILTGGPTRRILKSLAPRLAEEVVENKITKTVVRNVAEAPIRAGLMPSTIAGGIERQSPDISYDIATGKTEVTPGKSPFEAFARQYGESAVEAFSETVGGTVMQLWNKVKPPKAVTEPFLDKLFGRALSGKGGRVAEVVQEIKKLANFHGILPEVFEEEFAAPFTALINEENYDLPTTPEGIRRMIMSTAIAALFQGGGITLEAAERLAENYKLEFNPNKLGSFGSVSITKKDGEEEVPPKPEPKKAKPTRKVEDVEYENFVFEDFSGKLSEATGKTVTKEKIATEFSRLKTVGRVETVSDFIPLLEKRQAKAEQEGRTQEELAKKEAERDIIRFDEDTDAEISSIGREPQAFVEKAGIAVRNKKQALRAILEGDASRFETSLTDMVRRVEETGLGEEADIYEAIREEAERELDRIEKRKPKQTDRPKLQRVPKGASETLKERITQENRIAKAEHKLKQDQVLIDTLRERPTENKQIRREIVNFSKGFRAGSNKTKQDLTLLKKKIAGFARKYIPRSELRKREISKIFSKIATAKDPTQVKDALDTITQTAEGTNKRILLQKFDKLLKSTKAKKKSGLLKGKLTPEAQTIVEKVREFQGMELGEAQDRIEENIKKLLSEPDNVDLVLENEALSFAGMKEMNAQTLSERLDSLRQLVTGARQDRKEQYEARKRRKQAVKLPTVDVFTGKHFGRETPDPADGAKIAKKIDEISSSNLESWITMSDNLSRFDKGSMPDKSFVSESAYMAMEGTIKAGTINLEMTERIRQIAKDVFGEDISVKEMKQLFKEWGKEKEVAKGKDQNDEEIVVKMTDLEVVDFVMATRQLSTMDNVLNGEVLLDSTNRRYNLSEDLVDQIIESADPELLRFVEEQQKQILKPLGELQGPLIEAKTGMPFPNNPDYFPRSGERDVIQSAEDERMAHSFASMGIPGSSKARAKRVGTTIIKNPVSRIYNQIDEVSHFVGMYDFVQLYSQLFADKEWTAAIRDNFSPEFLKAYNGMFNDVAAGKIRTEEKEKTAVQAQNFLIDRIVIAQLGGKLGIMIKQLTSIPAFMAGSNPVEFAADVADFLSNPVKNYKELKENSVWLDLRHKLGKFEQDLDRISKSGAARTVLKSKSTVQILMLPIQFGDEGAIVIGGWHAYKKALRENGGDKKKAIRTFERVAASAQQESAMFARNKIQKVPLLRAFRTYKTTPFQYLQNELKYVRALRYERGSYKYSQEYEDAFQSILQKSAMSGEVVTEADIEKLNAFREVAPIKKSKSERTKIQLSHLFSFLIFHSLLGMIFQFVGSGFKWEGKKQARAAILGNFNAIPLIGDLVTAIWGRAIGEPFGVQTVVGSFLNQFINLSSKTIGIIKKLVGDEDLDLSRQDIKQLVKQSADNFGVITKFPLSGPVQMGIGALDLIQNRTSNYKRLLFSEYTVGKPKDEFLEELEKNGPSQKTVEMFRQLKKDGEYSKKTKYNATIKKRRKAGKVGKSESAPKKGNVSSSVDRAKKLKKARALQNKLK